MLNYDFSPFYRSTIGFDRLLALLDKHSAAESNGQTYPPYNIERTGENAYRITVAVAGFVVFAMINVIVVRHLGGITLRAAPALPPAPWRFTAVLLDPPRDALRAAIAARFGAMLDQGALDEVRDLLALGLDPTLPAMRAHGVPELRAYLDGDCTLETARQRACLVTAQYTKRQATWFRHHALGTGGMQKLFVARYGAEAQVSERILAEIKSFVHNRLDAPQHGT